MTTEGHSVASSDRGSRATRSGSRRLYLSAALTAIAVAVIAVLAIKPGGSAGASVHLRKATKYGQDRRWLKIPEPAAVTVETASLGHPELNAIEGYPVDTTLPDGATDIFVAGPSIPNWVSTEASDGKLKTGQSVPATYTVSFSHVTGHVPLSAGAFSLITYQGAILHPTVTTSTGAPLPATVPVGRTLRLTLTTSVPEGDGSIRWAPLGEKILVSYFWTLEFD